jgi:CARDB protein/Calx-beta domain-containing protein
MIRKHYGWSTLLAGLTLLPLIGSAGLAQTPLPKLPPSLPSPILRFPDLVVTAVNFEGGVFFGSCNRVSVTVKNAGISGVANPVTVRLNVSVPVAEALRNYDQLTSGGLAAGASTQVAFDQVGIPGGVPFSVGASIDPANAVQESNEGNNGMSVPASQLTSGTDCPRLSVAGGRAVEGKAVRFRVGLDKTFPRTVSVKFATADVTARGGPACSRDADYRTLGGTLTFPANTTALAQFIDVATCSDDVIEPAERFDFRLSDPVNASLPQDISATGTIDDLAPR